MGELSVKEKMKQEAVDRLGLLKARSRAAEKINQGLGVEKCVWDFENETADGDEAITKGELELIREFEENYGAIAYYLIKDQGMWPDGATFPRYTILYVSPYTDEWEMEREDGILRCKTIPAYVINMEDRGCSEITEIAYKNVDGMIVNMS